MPLGTQIRRYREAAGYTLEKLEELSGVDLGTLSALERRDSKKSGYAGQIARAFGLTVEQLLDDSQTFSVQLKYPAAKPSPPPVVQMRPPAAYLANGWPFAIELQRVMTLPDYDKGRIDGYMRALVEAHESAVKKSATT